MASFVGRMPPFNPDEEVGGNQALRWRTWLADFKMFLAASNITNKTRQRALLLYQAGPRGGWTAGRKASWVMRF